MQFGRVFLCFLCVRVLLHLYFESPGFLYNSFCLFIYFFRFLSVRWCVWLCADVVERCCYGYYYYSYTDSVVLSSFSWSNYNIYNAMRIDFFLYKQKLLLNSNIHSGYLQWKELNQKSTWSIYIFTTLFELIFTLKIQKKKQSRYLLFRSRYFFSIVFWLLVLLHEFCWFTLQ